jgi:glucokinase
MLQQEPYSISGTEQEITAASETGYVVGADIGGTSLRLALAGMSGKVVAKWKVSTAGIRDPQVVVRMIHDGVEDLLRQNHLSRSLLRAIAAGAPGVTNVDEGVVIATSYLMGWRDVPLRALLEDTFAVPAAVENDVNIAAIAESQIGAAQGVRDFVFLAVGTGIGAGIVLNERLFHGMNWSAGAPYPRISYWAWCESQRTSCGFPYRKPHTRPWVVPRIGNPGLSAHFAPDVGFVRPTALNRKSGGMGHPGSF